MKIRIMPVMLAIGIAGMVRADGRDMRDGGWVERPVAITNAAGSVFIIRGIWQRRERSPCLGRSPRPRSKARTGRGRHNGAFLSAGRPESSHHPGRPAVRRADRRHGPGADIRPRPGRQEPGRHDRRPADRGFRDHPAGGPERRVGRRHGASLVICRVVSVLRRSAGRAGYRAGDGPDRAALRAGARLGPYHIFGESGQRPIG